MEKALKEWLLGKKERVNQLLLEEEIKHNCIPKQDSIEERLRYRHELSHSVEGKEITQIIKEVAEKVNGRYPFQLIICNDYADYLTKLDSVNQVTTCQFEHDWEGAHNHIEDPIFIVANKESVEIYSVDETWDLVCLETRINAEWSA